MRNVAVIGAGAWGTTLAILLAEKGHEVTLWVYEKELASQMEQTRENKTFLPGWQLPKTIQITSEAKETKDAEVAFFVVPTQFLGSTAKKFKDVIKSNCLVISASKGIEEKSLNFPLDILKKDLRIKNLAVLSGPNLSAEIARGLPAASVVAAENLEIAKSAQEVLMLERFRVYVNSDPLGVQLGGALKNIIAIAAGVADGLELGNNAKAGLLIRGIAEITRLGIALGANPKTFAGLSGMGDIITTCSSKLSRNHFVGEQIAKGRKLPEILAGMKNIAEGVPTTKAALSLGEKHKVQLPVTKEVFAILYQGKDPFKSISALMTRTPTTE